MENSNFVKCLRFQGNRLNMFSVEIGMNRPKKNSNRAATRVHADSMFKAKVYSLSQVSYAQQSTRRGYLIHNIVG